MSSEIWWIRARVRCSAAERLIVASSVALDAHALALVAHALALVAHALALDAPAGAAATVTLRELPCVGPWAAAGRATEAVGRVAVVTAARAAVPAVAGLDAAAVVALAVPYAVAAPATAAGRAAVAVVAP